MKTTSLLAQLVLGMLVGALPAPAGTPAKERIDFDGRTYVLASQDGNAVETLKEFIPQGENLDRWTRLVSVRESSRAIEPKALVAAVLKGLKADNPLAPSSVIENPKTGDIIVDFVTWPKDGSFTEFNVFKYRKRADKPGLVALQFAWRGYGDKEAFFGKLKTERTRLIGLMAAGDFAVRTR